MPAHGEFVTNATATAKYRGLLETINRKRAPNFAAGVIVSDGESIMNARVTPKHRVRLQDAKPGRGRPQFCRRSKLADLFSPTGNVSNNALNAAKADPFRRSASQMQASDAQAIRHDLSNNNLPYKSKYRCDRNQFAVAIYRSYIYIILR
jgi:hypothetical protein